MPFYSTEELRALSPDQAKEYCAHLRSVLVDSVSVTGGHLASNLGITEISVALARGMDLPREKVIYDTGHQCYVHKLLTGRGESFSTLRSLDGISGFPRREESEFDAFGTGHSGTGVSAALGFAKAAALQKDPAFSVAVIGDGSFTGGMVFEALNNIAPTDRLIIILNDNGMSISKSVGTIKRALNSMRTAGYYRFKGEVRDTFSHLPLVGKPLSRLVGGLKRSVKRSALPMGNLFESFGLHYFGPADGNDLETVEFLLREAKKKNGPSLIHLCTKKGKGYAPAEKDPSGFHGISPKGGKKSGSPSFSSLFGRALVSLAERDDRIVAITAAMKDGVGLTEFAKRFPHRFFDVGIAEEHALTFATALCAAGLKPCFAVYSTFYQRAVDQLLHDAALQKLPVVLCLDRAGISGEDGATHHGVFDLPLTLPIPGVKIYAPLSGKELEEALRRAFAETECPSVIRYAKDGEDGELTEHFPLTEAVEWKNFGTDPHAAIVTFGRSTKSAVRVAEASQKEGISCRVIRFGMLKGFDPTLLASAFSGIGKALLVEEGVLVGGFGSYLESLLEKQGLLQDLTVKKLGVGEAFVPHGNTSLLLSRLGLGEEEIKKEWLNFVTT